MLRDLAIVLIAGSLCATPVVAFQEMKQYNFGADFLHPEFKAFVYDYRPELAPASRHAVTSSASRP